MEIEQVRALFPGLDARVYGKPLVYFDNAATSQRPLSVVRAFEESSLHANANLHRAVHCLAETATRAYEDTRDAVRAFIGAAHREEIIFTAGTTAAVNLLAFSFGEAFVGEGDEIIVTEAEHHSNLVPWQLLCLRKKAVLKVLPVDDSGHLRVDLLPDLLTDRTRLLAVAQVSNVLGLAAPLPQIIRAAHARGCAVFVDGAQGIVHDGVDVQALDCDFYAFSGHKMYAATGTGVLYGKKKWLEAMPPYQSGGEMISTVRWDGTTFAPLPAKFEAGTQNINGVPTLVPAIEMFRLLSDGALREYAGRVSDRLAEGLAARGDIHLYGTPSAPGEKIPLYSFTVEGVHHEDLALVLDKMGFAVRSGQMCAEPLMDRFGVTGMVRVSLLPYNTMEEVERFLDALDAAVTMLRG